MTYYTSNKAGKTRSVNITAETEDQTDTIYTCPSNTRAHMPLLYIKNVSGGNCTVRVVWNRADGSQAYILGGKNFSNGEYIQWSGAFIVFEPGDTMVVTPSNNASPRIDAFVTVEEFYITNQ
jgi:hypothetical protein